MGTRPARQPLGRGLASLLGDVSLPSPGNEKPGLRQIPLDLLEPNPFQPRTGFPKETLDELAESIRARGILQPLLVRPHPADPGRFRIVAGERRWRAAGMAGLHEVPAVVQEMSDADAAASALIENLLREDLNPIDEAEGYNRLLDELGWTQDSLAEVLGKSRTHITNALRLLNLPASVQAEVRNGTLSFGHARALLGHPDPEAMAALVRDKALTVRQTEAAISRAAAGPKNKAQGRLPDVTSLERDLTARLGFRARVRVDRHGRVSVGLDFADTHQLEAWMASLKG